MLESNFLQPSPASTTPGLQQIFGDVWEWTSSGYTGYPGYKPLPGALGEYNGKFMSSQVILRGGSCVTPCHPHPRHLPQLLPTRHPLAVQRPPPRQRPLATSPLLPLRNFA